MTLPEGVQPSGPTDPVPEATVSSEPAVEATPAPEPVVADLAPVVEEPPVDEASAAEDASDAALRAWARDNGIEGVPGSGKLSAAWREQITAAMTAALDPKEEVSAEATSPESSISVETETTSTSEENPHPTEEPKQPEPVFEYRSVFEAPNTFVSSQAYTA